MERGVVTDLVAPAVEEVVGDGEEESEEDGVGEVERERKRVRGLGRNRCCPALIVIVGEAVRVINRRFRRPPSDIHWKEYPGREGVA